MMPPNIEICIEGYNIEQTDFYLAHIIDKYNSLNELYKKSCEHIVFLEKECKDGFYTALAETEARITKKLDCFEKRLSVLENQSVVVSEEVAENDIYSESVSIKETESEKFKAELSSFHSELEDIKSLLFR